MLVQWLGILTGFFSGMVWEMIATAPYKNHQTLINSILLDNYNKLIHLHHWVLYFFLIILLVIWSARTDRLFHPAVLMIILFLLGAIAFNYYKYQDFFIF